MENFVPTFFIRVKKKTSGLMRRNLPPFRVKILFLVICPDNCENCKTSDKCLICETGYGLDKDSKCAVCPENCLTCETTEKCLTCKAGFGLEKYQCIVCPALTELINGICIRKKIFILGNS